MLYHPNISFHTSQVLKKSPLTNQINKLSYFNKKIPNKIAITAEKLRKQCLDIYEVLKPLEQMGINFEMWLVGGSVRDLLLNKSELVSDLDICISFKSHAMTRQISPSEFLEYSGLSVEDFPFPSIAWRDGDRTQPAFSHWNIIYKTLKGKNNKERSFYNAKMELDYAKNNAFTSICYEMLYCLLATKFELYQEFPPKCGELDIDNQYASDRLDGVLKLKSSEWNWGCDILVTKQYPQDFINSFDFGICKVAIELVKPNFSKYNVDFFPKDVQDLFLRVHFTKEFLKDIKTKKHVVRLENHASLHDIERSLEKHLPKIIAKYDWPIVLKEIQKNSGIADIQEKTDYVKAFLRKEKLQLILEEKTTSVVKPLKI